MGLVVTTKSKSLSRQVAGEKLGFLGGPDKLSKLINKRTHREKLGILVQRVSRSGDAGDFRKNLARKDETGFWRTVKDTVRDGEA